MSDRDDLALTITSLNYGELRQIGDDLAGMCEDKEARPHMKTGKDFADMLFDWAESQRS
jgi:hypothetical protein